MVEDRAQFLRVEVGAMFEGDGEQPLQFSRVTVEDPCCGIDQHRHDIVGAGYGRRYL